MAKSHKELPEQIRPGLVFFQEAQADLAPQLEWNVAPTTIRSVRALVWELRYTWAFGQKQVVDVPHIYGYDFSVGSLISLQDVSQPA